MKKNIHPYYQSKINIYTNGSTYLPSVPLLVKDLMGDQVSGLATNPKASFLSTVQTKLKKSNFHIGSLGNHFFRMESITVFSSDVWLEKKDKRFWQLLESDIYSNPIWSGKRKSHLNEDSLNQVSKFRKRYTSF